MDLNFSNIDYNGNYLGHKYYFKITMKPYQRPDYTSLRTDTPKVGEMFGFADSLTKSFNSNRNVISLPIPQFEDSISSEYTDYDPTIKGAMFDDIVNKKVKDFLREFISGTFTNAGNLNAGQAIVESKQKKFKNVKPRSFTFKWTFKPLSADEAKDVAKIVMAFKMGALPSNNSFSSGSAAQTANIIDTTTLSLAQQLFDSNAGSFNFLAKLSTIFETVKMPDTFYISPMGYDVKNDPRAWLFAFKPMYVTNVSIKYGENEKIDFFRDGYPTTTELSVTFLEVTDLRRQDYIDIPLKLGSKINEK